MHWILQNNIFAEEGHASLLRVLDAMGLPYSLHKIVPFTDRLDPEPKPAEGNVICIGSYALLKVAMAQRWSPGVFTIRDYSHSELLALWGARMLNNGVQCELQNVSKTLIFQSNSRFFLRPATDEKFFPGRLYDKDEYQAWIAGLLSEGDAIGSGTLPTTEVYVAAPKQIYAEYRTWIIDGRVVTSSSYKLQGRLHTGLLVDDEIVTFAEDSARVWSPARAFCLDIATTPDGLRIVEPNTLNFSGFYAADLGKLVGAIESAFSE